ncbi:MAG: outer membrane protein transport protein [Steroidobacteraceae bacterium]
MKNLHGRTILGAFVALALAAGSASATNGYYTTGTGTKSKAQAGAGTANPQEVMSLATNPANIAFVPESIDAGLGLFSPMRDYATSPSQINGNFGAFTIGPNKIDSEGEFFPIPFVGMNRALSDVDFLAAAFYARGGMNTKWVGGTATFDPDGPGPAPVTTFDGTYGGGTAGVDLMQAFLNLTYARKFSDQFSLGASAIFAMQRFEARGVSTFAGFTETFARSGGTVMPKNLSGNGHDMSYGYGASVGFQWNPTDMFSFAAAYTTKMSMGEFGDYADLFAEQGGFDMPATATIGLAIKPNDRLALMFDWQEIWYSDVSSVGNPIQNLFACPTAGQGGTDLESCLGGNRGAGFGWEDISVYKFGGSYQLDDTWTLRGGYSFTDQPIPKDQMTFNILAPAVMEDHFSVGFTKKQPSGNELNMSFMYAPEQTLKGPNNFDPTQTVEFSMHQFELEVSYSWK